MEIPVEPVELLAVGGMVLVSYFAALYAGRWLKRRHGVKLGFLYQVFCISIGLYVPILLKGYNFAWAWLNLERELRAALVLLGSVFFLALLDRFLWHGYFERRRQRAVPKFLRDVAAILFVALSIGFIIGFIYGKAPAASLIAGSGVVAIILGFALQDLLGNVFSGIAIEIGRPFRPGDWLLVDTTYGKVIDVNWRSIRVQTNDDITHEIPNNQIVRNTIVNLSYPAKPHAMRLVVRVDYNVPPNPVKELFVEATKDVPGVLKTPEPVCLLHDFADSAIIYQMKYYMDDHRMHSTTSDGIRTNIWYALRRAGIRTPYPIRKVQFEQDKPTLEREEEALSGLMNSPLLATLDDQQRRSLVESGRHDRYGSGERIIEQGTPGESMFVLLEGRADVIIETVPGEPTTRVAGLRAGDCFGEMSALTGEKRSATIVAEIDCEVLEIGKEAFSALLKGAPELAEALGELLAERRMANEGFLAEEAGKAIDEAMRRRNYTARFLNKLGDYFGL
jgi:branched-chain amino acid transport system substrate-binding protein